MNTDKNLLIFFVYAPPNEADKALFWTDLTTSALQYDIPFIIIGDLNEIQDFSEKCGGLVPNQNRFERLTKFKNECGLNEIPSVGNKFTWRKNRT